MSRHIFTSNYLCVVLRDLIFFIAPFYDIESSVRSAYTQPYKIYYDLILSLFIIYGLDFTELNLIELLCQVSW